MKADTPDQQLFFVTTRISAASPDGKRFSTGTGFIVAEKIDEQRQILFVVTCRHVVEGFSRAALSFVATKDGKPQLGEKCEVVVEDLDKMVFFNSDAKVDVALIPFVPVLNYFKAQKKEPFFRSLDRSLIPTSEQVQELSAIQPILFVGYPAGIRDEKNLLPIARRGFTATPYFVDYNGLPLFVVDAMVYLGSSGSPVLVFDQGAYAGKSATISLGTRTHLLGLISQAYFDEVEGQIQFKATPSATSQVYKETRYLNLGIVIKAKAIFDTIDQYIKKHPPTS